MIFAVFGWYANKLIRNLYLSKGLSDQSLTLDAMWFLFATIQSIGLAFVSPLWFAGGLVAFVAYRFAVSAGFKASAVGHTCQPAVSSRFLAWQALRGGIRRGLDALTLCEIARGGGYEVGHVMRKL